MSLYHPSSLHPSQMLPHQSLSAQPILKVTPAKARKLESVMRGMSQHGITQIGFGSNATTVDVHDLYPMEISKSIPEEKDIDEQQQQPYPTYNSTTEPNKVNKMSVRGKRRSSMQSIQDGSSRDGLAGKKRRGSEVPLQNIGNPFNKRVCNNHATTADTANIAGNELQLMMVEDTNSRSIAGTHDDMVFSLQSEKQRLNEELQNMHRDNTHLDEENSSLRQRVNELQQTLCKHVAISEKYELEAERNVAACESLKELLNEIAISERQERESKLLEDNKLLGRVVQHQANSFGHVSDIWEDGQLFEDLKRRKKEYEDEKSELEQQKKELRRLRLKRAKEEKERQESAAAAAGNADASTTEMEMASNNHNHNEAEKPVFMAPSNQKQFDALSLEAEIISIRLALLKKRLNELEIEYQQIEYRKKRHIKFIRLMRDEKKSRFSLLANHHQCQILNERYVLINLLGRGGFSEVHRAYDLSEHKYVACKIHQLNVHWSDERKKNYTKHATREYDIHKSLNHRNIVSLYDVFGIDVNSFCTVLGYCNGMDLDMYLKINKTLLEKEARSLIVQVFVGLKYLHSQSNPGPIIHYDLKPGNLLYRNGVIKLTDFGLAKIINSAGSNADHSGEIELTSQGAGTYWYLPPECFRQSQSVMISPKVDIWSVGVIYFQMLYGKRPFGDNLSQDSILNNKTILNARCVNFPTHPKTVSRGAKELIVQCCAYDPKLRLSSSQIVDNHPYFDFLRK